MQKKTLNEQLEDLFKIKDKIEDLIAYSSWEKDEEAYNRSLFELTKLERDILAIKLKIIEDRWDYLKMKLIWDVDELKRMYKELRTIEKGHKRDKSLRFHLNWISGYIYVHTNSVKDIKEDIDEIITGKGNNE